MVTPDQRSNITFKNLFLNVSSTNPDRQFFEEPLRSVPLIQSDQIIVGTIPNSAPLGPPSTGTAGISGDVELVKDLQLLSVVGTSTGFYHPDLKNAIPFNYGDFSYIYYITLNGASTSPIYFGDGSWIVDPAAGTLTFYEELPAGVSSALPPKISFYRYIGPLGTISDPFNLNNTGTHPGNLRLATVDDPTLDGSSMIELDKPIEGDATFIKFVNSENTNYDGTIFSLSDVETRTGSGIIGDRLRLVGPHQVIWDENTLIMKVKVPTSVNGVVTTGDYYIPLVKLQNA